MEEEREEEEQDQGQGQKEAENNPEVTEDPGQEEEAENQGTGRVTFDMSHLTEECKKCYNLLMRGRKWRTTSEREHSETWTVYSSVVVRS